jgi:hypothetical protein
MSFSRRQYERAAEQFFKQNPKSFEKYFAPNLLQTLTDAMLSSLPTTTAAKIVFDRLVANGTLPRTDGRTERDDAAEAVAQAEEHLNKVAAKVAAPPLRTVELELFYSLSVRDLADRYWENNGFNEFRVRYDRAVREYLFRVPPRPQQAVETQSEGEFELTAAEYHALPAREVLQRLRSPKFKAAVYKLIAAKKI